MPDQNSNLYRFEKFIILYNPASTNAKRSRRRIEDLRKLFPAREIIVQETSPDGQDANKKIIKDLAKQFEDNTILCIGSGDGTVSQVLDTLLTEPSIKDKTKKIVILPLWGGNANDLAYMLNGYSMLAKTRKIFENGEIVPIYPIKFDLENKDQKTTRIVACYASFGASAFATKNMETPKRRSRKIYKIPGTRMLAESSIVIYSFIKAKNYKAVLDKNEKEIYEHIFINGSRLAKVERVPMNLKNKEFYEAVFDRKHPVILLNVLKALRNRSYGRASKGPISFILKSSVLAQFDGEIENIKSGTKITATISDEPINVLATRL